MGTKDAIYQTFASAKVLRAMARPEYEREVQASKQRLTALNNNKNMKAELTPGKGEMPSMNPQEGHPLNYVQTKL